MAVVAVVEMSREGRDASPFIAFVCESKKERRMRRGRKWRERDGKVKVDESGLRWNELEVKDWRSSLVEAVM